ncbi:MAG: helix-turn-helix domain-containing protein [Caldisphaera sp.]
MGQEITKNNTINGYVAFYSNDSKYSNQKWNEFFEELKGHNSIQKIERIETLTKGKTYLVKLESILEDSMSQLVNKYSCPYFNEIFNGGYETWYIYSWYEFSDGLIEDIKKRTKIVNFEKLDQEEFPKRILPFYEDKYFNLLSDLYTKGYYSLHKELKLKDIASSYGTSKSNISKKLKKAEISAISHYINFKSCR